MLDSATIEILMSKFLIGTLIFIRVSGMMVSAPLFRSIAIIPQVKIFLSAIIALSMTAAFWKEQPVIEFHLWFLALLAIKEFMLGALMGFAANMVFNAVRMGGGLIDFEMGYQTSSLFDPSSNNPTLIGELKELIALMIFLILNGHHQLIESIYASIRAVPLTTFQMSESTYMILIKLITTMFILAVKISSPVLVALFCANLALALLARVAPQTNIFVISFQMKVLIGLLVLMVSMPLMIYLIKWALGTIQNESMQIIMTLYPGRI